MCRYLAIDRDGNIGYSGKKGHHKQGQGRMHDAAYKELELKGVPFVACKLTWELRRGGIQEMVLGGDLEETRDIIKKAYEKSRDKGCVLVLKNLGLPVMPAEILRMVELVKLDLCGNQFTHLPRLLFPALEELYLDYNHFTLVPRTIYEDSTGLKILSLVENPIVRLPTELGRMPNLKELRMNVHFTLESPPTVVLAKKKQLQFLRQMNSAEQTGKLELIDFDLNVLPREISSRWDEHPEYHNMVALTLKTNALMELEQGVDKWIKLTQLDISENKLLRLPIGMGVLIHLKDFRMDKNEVRELPR